MARRGRGYQEIGTSMQVHKTGRPRPRKPSSLRLKRGQQVYLNEPGMMRIYTLKDRKRIAGSLMWIVEGIEGRYFHPNMIRPVS
jgi:hypothetical protein